jgi:hypothetical protein
MIILSYEYLFIFEASPVIIMYSPVYDRYIPQHSFSLDKHGNPPERL